MVPMGQSVAVIRLMMPTSNNFSLTALSRSLLARCAIANIFVDLSMIFVSLFFVVFVLFWILNLYIHFLCILCKMGAAFSHCVCVCVSCARHFDISMAFLEMSITPLITIDFGSRANIKVDENQRWKLSGKVEQQKWEVSAHIVLPLVLISAVSCSFVNNHWNYSKINWNISTNWIEN